MQQQIRFEGADPASPFAQSIDAALEIGAYEDLWCQQSATFKSLADQFRRHPGARPSDLVPADRAMATGERVIRAIRERTRARFDVRVHGEVDYPDRLRDATHPVELLYFQGDWSLVQTPSVAVVGTRKPTEKGDRRTRQLVRALVADNFTIVSGLAAGVDTAAHETALQVGGRTIAVIGTPLGDAYPKGNAALQERIAREHLLVSQVPVERYQAQDYRANRLFFPERNKTMAALTQATIIVEAGETSGTLIQAREAIKQGRKLFILESCFANENLSWPARFEREGAIRVREYDNIRRELVGQAAEDRSA